MKYVHPDNTNRKEIKAKAEPAIRFAEILLIYAEALNELEDGSSYDISDVYKRQPQILEINHFYRLQKHSKNQLITTQKQDMLAIHIW